MTPASPEKAALPLAATEPGSRNLLRRIAAALVLAPVAIALAYAGGSLWIGLVTLAAAGLFIEWLMVVGALNIVRVGAPGVIALIISAIFLALGRIDASLYTVATGIVVVALLAPARRQWCSLGLIYAAAAQFCAVLVRMDVVTGFVALIFVLLVVWVTDIGGYFAGRGIGGPKLWPRVSPKKTWAGAIGGFAASLVVAAGFAVVGTGKIAVLLALSAVLSVASQFGDLFESWVKRRFGVKDSSQIIPGHGGLLDRLDGFVAAIVLAAAIGLVRAGVGGVGSGLMIW